MSKPECPEKALGTEGQPTTNSTYIWPEANANAKAKANSKPKAQSQGQVQGQVQGQSKANALTIAPNRMVTSV